MSSDGHWNTLGNASWNDAMCSRTLPSTPKAWRAQEERRSLTYAASLTSSDSLIVPSLRRSDSNDGVGCVKRSTDHDHEPRQKQLRKVLTFYDLALGYLGVLFDPQRGLATYGGSNSYLWDAALCFP